MEGEKARKIGDRECMEFNNPIIDMEASSGKFVESGERYSFSGRKTGKLDEMNCSCNR